MVLAPPVGIDCFKDCLMGSDGVGSDGFPLSSLYDNISGTVNPMD